MFCCSLTISSFIILLFLFLIILFNKINKKNNYKLTNITKLLLLNKDKIESECEKICTSLSNKEIVKSEKECAEQLRDIVKSRYLEYKTLETNPEYLLRANRHICNSDHGALATRFTVQYNLYSGSIVALGNEIQRQRLYDTQDKAELGCFAFTEIGAGVLSGAGVETTAEYDPIRKVFIIHSPTPTSSKTWISQGMYAEHAVILANLIMPNGKDEKDKNKGPHIFFTRIQNRNEITGDLTPINNSIKLTSLPQKTALWGLDNAYIEFDHFEVPRTDLLSKFSNVNEDGVYELNLPLGNKRMLDLLLSRLLTGRVCLSEYTIGIARSILQTSYQYASTRELWQNSKQKASGAPKDLMSEKPLISNAFVNYSESLAIVAHFIAHTREQVGECIRKSLFPDRVIEAVCICKFVGTSFGVDSVSAIRKLLGSRALLEESRLGPSSFVCNATCAAEGDNTIMELKILGDLFKGGMKSIFPQELIINSLKRSQTRILVIRYILLVLWAMILGKSAFNDGQLLRDIAWCRANLIILNTWFTFPPKYDTDYKQKDLDRMVESYDRILMKYPTPVCH